MVIAEREKERDRTPLNSLFPVSTPVWAFHPHNLRMEEARVSGYLVEKPSPSPYAVVVTFTDSTSHFYYRAYIDAHNSARSLVVRR